MKKSEIQIFLAHANEDKEAVLKLYDLLNKSGYKPWMDKKDLVGGQEWKSVIQEEIAKSQLFVACFSRHSTKKQGFVQREFRMALTNAADRPPGSIYIIPIRLDECEIPDLRHEEYGINLRERHWIDYWEPDGFEQLEKAIAHQYGPFEIIKESTVEVELKSEKGVDYTKLRDLLAEGKWKEANQETSKVMRLAGGYASLCYEDMDNFPCEDLRTINQLWLHYSEGKFGFSVQKEIYESLGGTRKYNEKVFYDFCDRVGWRQKARWTGRKATVWMDYDELTFNLEHAPKGHLPTQLFWIWRYIKTDLTELKDIDIIDTSYELLGWGLAAYKKTEEDVD